MDKNQSRSDRAAGSDPSSSFEVPALPEGIGLQPQLDSIFADVQASLPSIDFDISDVSSDEEIAIVSRSLKTPTLLETDPNQEVAMSPETWRSVLEPTNESPFNIDAFQRYANDLGHQSPTRKASDSSDGSAAELMSMDPSIIQMGTAQPLTVEGAPLNSMNSNSGDSQVQSWSDLVNTLGVQGNGIQAPTVANPAVIPYSSIPGSNRDTGIAAFPDAGLYNRASPETVVKTKPGRPSTDSEKTQQISSMIPTQIPTLAMHDVEDIDLDLLLDSFPAAATQRSPRENSRQPARLETGGGDGAQKDGGSMSLMEKLAQLCVQQSDGTLSKSQLLGSQQQQQQRSPRTPAAAVKAARSTMEGPSVGRKVAWAEGAAGATRQDKKMREMGTNTGMDDATCKPPKLTASIGVSTQSRPSMMDYSTHGVGAGARIAKKGRTETVFLDLRATAAAEEEEKTEVVPDSVKRILKLNSPGGSESDSGQDSDDDKDENLELWRENRKRGLPGPSPPPNKTKKGAPRATPPPRVIMPHPVKEQTKTKPPTSLSEVSQIATAATPKTDPAVAEKALARTLPSTPPPSPAATGMDDTGRLEQALQEEMRKKLREQREQERATRLRLQKRLEALRPLMSASGKRPSASATSIIYDLEASYTAAPDCLPPVLGPNHECALLTVQLSTNGEIIPQRCPVSSRCSSENRISITYPVLLTWLLSLVPPSFDYLTEGIKTKMNPLPKSEAFPFWVVGLQQVYQNGGLVLNVAVMPTGATSSKQNLLKRKTKGLGKEGTRDSTLFQTHLSTYLTIHTLLSACPWVDNTFACAIRRDGDVSDLPNEQAHYDTVQDDGSYIPALPHISSKPLSMLLTLSQDRASVRRVFGSGKAAFFWQTVDSDEIISEQTSSEEYDSHTDIQTTMSLVYKSVYRNPKHMMGFLYRVLQEGLDIAGVRLLFHSEELLKANSSPREVNKRKDSHLSPSQQDLEHINKVGPILAIAVRGAMARTRWLDAVGPSDPQLARRTDPRSLVALFGGQSREEVPMYCPRNPNRVNYELALWFGGRVPDNGVVDIGSTTEPDNALLNAEPGRGHSSSQRSKRGKKGSQTDLASPDMRNLKVIRKPPSMLVATTPSDIFLVVSPIVPPISIGSILCACQVRGYQLRGVRRLRLNNRRVAALGLSGPQVRAFNPLSCTTPTSPAKSYEQSLKERLEAEFPQANPSPMPSLVFLLRKENAMHHASCLMEAMMINLCMNGMLTTIKESSPSGALTANLCFHIVPYSETLLGQLGGDLTSLPGSSSLPHSGLGSPPPGGFYTNPELEQIVVVTLSGTVALKTIGNTMSRLLGLYPFTTLNQPPPSPASAGQGLELLGLKWLASLTAAQAKELTPYEVGDRYWQPSVKALASNPALVCIVRGLNAPQLVQSILGTSPVTGALPGKGIANLERIMSTSAESAFRQSTMFFRDQELFADPSMRVNLPYLPPIRSPSLEQLSTARFAWAETEESTPTKGKKGKGKSVARQQGKGMLVVEESIYKAMLVGPRLLTTVAVIKPLAFHKHLSKILKRIAQESFTVVAMRLTLADDAQARALIPAEDKEDKMLSAMHREHLQSGPLLLLCLQRENAVRKLLDLLGPANPQEARRQSQFLWRGMYGADPINNGIHGSESYLAAVSEQKLLFPDGLCCRETPDLQADKIVCPAGDAIMGYQQASQRRLVTKPYPVRTESSESLPSPVTSDHSLTSISSGSSTSSTDLLRPLHSALCQTNCLLLTPPLLLTKVKGYHRAHIEVVDALLVHGFAVVGLRMVWFGEDQAHEYSGVYTKAFPSLPKILCHGPSIVVAVQRDNAVSCFDALLGSCFDKESIISKYGEHILRPKDPKEATRHLEFFFDRLTPRSQSEIVPS